MPADRRASRRDYAGAIRAHPGDFFGGLLLVVVAFVVVAGALDRVLPDGIATAIAIVGLGVAIGLVLQRFERRHLR